MALRRDARHDKVLLPGERSLFSPATDGYDKILSRLTQKEEACYLYCPST